MGAIAPKPHPLRRSRPLVNVAVVARAPAHGDTMAFPSRNELTICFAHVAYRMADRFAARNTGIRHFQVNSLEELTVRVADADVVSVSMMWRNNLIARAPKLKFIQSISAGLD